MKIAHTKIITMLIVAIIALTAATALAGKNYNSSKSNTFSISKVNEEVGNILLRYGVGGAEINEVTDALAIGISEDELNKILSGAGINDEGIQEIHAEFDGLGIGIDDEEPAAATGIIKVLTPEREISSPDTGDIIPQGKDYNTSRTIRAIEVEKAGEGDARRIKKAELIEAMPSSARIKSENGIIKIRDGDGATIRKRPGRTKYSNIILKRSVFQDASKNIIRNIRAAAPEERESLINELRANRETFQTEIVSMNLKSLNSAKELRENFRANVGTTGADWEYKRIARIANAHGKGLRMINRFRSATARFEHILGRLESRVEKLETRGYEIDSFFDVFVSIEEAKNMQFENEAKMEELKAKYESLLEGENSGKIAEEAREITKELKAEIRNLHDKLREIVEEIKLVMANFNSSRSNKSEN